MENNSEDDQTKAIPPESRSLRDASVCKRMQTELKLVSSKLKPEVPKYKKICIPIVSEATKAKGGRLKIIPNDKIQTQSRQCKGKRKNEESQ